MIGLCSVTFRNESVENVIQIAKDAGLEVIEWGSDTHVPSGDLDNAKHVASLMSEAGLETSSYGTYYRVGSDEDSTPYIETAEQLVTKMVRVWAGDKGSAEADSNWFDIIIEETESIAKKARENGMSISFEYHQGTLTDTPESAYQLIEAIESPNVFLYWQPAETLSVEERINSLSYLGNWITNIHVFHWEDFYNRYALEEGAEEWEQYIQRILTHSPYTHHYLFEFVKNNDPEQLKKDAQTLKRIVNKLEI